MTGTTRTLPLFDPFPGSPQGEAKRVLPARPSGPATSHEAAGKVDVARCELLFLRSLAKLELATAYHVAAITDYKITATIRKRAGGLKKAGLIVACGRGVTPDGNSCEMFRLTELGKKKAGE